MLYWLKILSFFIVLCLLCNFSVLSLSWFPSLGFSKTHYFIHDDLFFGRRYEVSTYLCGGKDDERFYRSAWKKSAACLEVVLCSMEQIASRNTRSSFSFARIHSGKLNCAGKIFRLPQHLVTIITRLSSLPEKTSARKLFLKFVSMNFPDFCNNKNFNVVTFISSPRDVSNDLWNFRESRRRFWTRY